MATVNNWLAFSLSPQDLPPSQTESTLISAAATDEVSGDVCFNIPQDWSMRGSELSALVAEPKLEDFLGGINFSEHHHQHKANLNVIPSSSYASSGVASTAYHHQLYHHHPSSALHFADSGMVASSAAAGVHDDGGAMLSAATVNGANGGSIGLSMIKNWLRSQPAPPPPQSGDGAQQVAQGLSLSMNMAGTQVVAGGMPPLAGERGGRAPPESTVSTSAQGGARKEDSNGSGGAGALVAVSTDTGGSGGAETAARKTVDTFGQRTSIYRGVTRHRWTGRYEAHLWDNSCRREGQTRKGRQGYIGGYDKEEKAARAYDLAALKYWGPTTTTNFPVSNYEKELEEMKHMTRQEFVASLRRKSSGFSRGASIYRGVTRHHQHGRWQARIGRVAGNKDLYLGTFSTQEEAAEAYDIAAIKFRGLNAVTNFDMSRYDVKSILDSSALPIGSAAKRLKEAEAAAAAQHVGVVSYDVGRIASHLGDGGAAALAAAYGAHHYHAAAAAAAWPTIAFQPPGAAATGLYHPYAQPMRGWCKQEQDHAVIAAAHSLQELHHLNLGAAASAGGAHDFFSPAGQAAAMHGLGSSIDNSSLEHSTGSNSVVYNGVGDSNNGGSGGGGYMMPMSAAAATTTTAMVSHHEQVHGRAHGDHDEAKQMGYESYLVSAEAAYGGGGRMPSWTPASAASPVTAAASSNDNMAGVGHGGAQIFSVWNDT
ncbi:hypothetical protein HU200_054199 [Digitaria exilis]|uniref:AP2/ERF domain-containing protein n=1 Tax=Digitaria exilis TaxID=1010633 RepID=A0A835AQ92_9POAL|nr:hypothetical protein HU200_054199 [Digitaria exilis]